MTFTTGLALWLLADCITFLLFRRECMKVLREKPDERNFATAAEKLFTSPLHMTIALILGLFAWPVVFYQLLKDMIFGR